MKTDQHKAIRKKISIGMLIMLLSFFSWIGLTADLWAYVIISVIFVFGACMSAWGFALFLYSKGRSAIVGGACGLLIGLAPSLLISGFFILIFANYPMNIYGAALFLLGIVGIALMITFILLPNKKADKGGNACGEK